MAIQCNCDGYLSSFNDTQRSDSKPSGARMLCRNSWIFRGLVLQKLQSMPKGDWFGRGNWSMRAPLQCATSENCRQLVCPSQLTLDWNKIRCAKNVHTWTRYLCKLDICVRTLRNLNSKLHRPDRPAEISSSTTGSKCWPQIQGQLYQWQLLSRRLW